jgi:GNAT superfamily N-acetyltransferase
MAAADLPAVDAIARTVHPAFPEDVAVFAERLAFCPEACRMAEDVQRRPVGYAVAYPYPYARTPQLDVLLGRLPEGCDALYLHDVALLPDARGAGLGRSFLAHAEGVAVRLGLRALTLTAVYDAARYWGALGFRRLDDVPPELAAKLAGYGPGACYMVKDAG